MLGMKRSRRDPFSVNQAHSRWNYRNSMWMVPIMIIFVFIVVLFPLMDLGEQRFTHSSSMERIQPQNIERIFEPLTRTIVNQMDDPTNSRIIEQIPGTITTRTNALQQPLQQQQQKKRQLYRYSLNFLGQNVRPVVGDLRAFGYGYIDLDPETPAICLNISIVGTPVEFVSLSGPLEGIGEQSIFSDECIRFTMGELSPRGRYESCINVVSDNIGIPLAQEGKTLGQQHNPLYGSNTIGNSNEVLYRCQRDNSRSSVRSLVNDIINDPSRYYLLLRTPSKPMGSLWSNFGGQWDVVPEAVIVDHNEKIKDDIGKLGIRDDDDLHAGNYYQSEKDN